MKSKQVTEASVEWFLQRVTHQSSVPYTQVIISFLEVSALKLFFVENFCSEYF